jgi:hypothetical protein
MWLYYIAILAVHTCWLARVSHFQSVVIVVLLNVLKWPYSLSKDLHQFSLHFLHALYVHLKSLLVVWTFKLFNDEVSPLNQHISHYLTMTNFSYLKIANINELGLQNSWFLLCHYHDNSFLKIVMKYVCLVLYLGFWLRLWFIYIYSLWFPPFMNKKIIILLIDIAFLGIML